MCSSWLFMILCRKVSVELMIRLLKMVRISVCMFLGEDFLFGGMVCLMMWVGECWKVFCWVEVFSLFSID